MTAAVDRVVAALEARGHPVRNGSATCPAHEDRNPSLTVSEGRDGRALVKCHAGCDTGDVVAALGLEVTDLFDKPAKASRSRTTPGRVVARYPYVDPDGTVLYEVVRYDPKSFRQRRPDGRGGWTWGRGDVRRSLYRLPDVIAEADSGGTIYVVEGEKDADAAAQVGVVATCGPEGAGKWGHVADVAHAVLVGTRVRIVADRDAPGAAHALDVYRSLVDVAESVEVVEAKVGKDLADHLGAGLAIEDLVAVDVADLEARCADEMSRRRDISGGANETPDADDGPPVLPSTLWDARPDLAAIRDHAYSRLVSPDAVLGAVLARIAVSVPHSVKLPRLIGGAIGLTSYLVIVGRPGLGKSAADKAAGEIVPTPPNVVVLPAGTGEGLTEALMGEVDDPETNRKVREQVRHAALVSIDEGQVVGDLGDRKGSTLLSMLRSAWTDGQLGNANAAAERRRIIPAGNYVYGIVMGLQPAKAGPILDDVAGGTPQRCLWMSAAAPGLPDHTVDAPDWTWTPPTPNDLEAYADHVAGYRRHIVEVAAGIVDEITARRRDVVRGAVILDEWDAHEHLARLKVAALLAIVDGRLEVTVDDWQLAEIITTTSADVRDYCRQIVAADKAAGEIAHRHNLVGRDAAIDDAQTARALHNAAEIVARRAKRDGAPITRKQIRNALGKRYRDLVGIDVVIDRCIVDGTLVAIDGNTWTAPKGGRGDVPPDRRGRQS